MTGAIDITAGQKETLLAFLRQFIPAVAVWAYGSRVKGTARTNSDLDLVAFTTPAQRSVVSELKDAIAESNIPFLVDLHVWDEVPERFREIIREKYVVVQEGEISSKIEERPIMTGEWKTARLVELCEQIADCPHSTPLWTDRGVLVLRNQNIRYGRLDLSSPSYTDEEHFEQRSRRANLRAGDLVLTREAPMGEVCMVIHHRASYKRCIVFEATW
jgi:predicted nucleotidyltransferase